MIHFVFCHGFGFDIHFWDPINPYFAQEKCSFIDLGYFNHSSNLPFLNKQDVLVGIGHSIGLSKLISMYSNFDYLIGLNSFTNFLSSEQILYKQRQKELRALKANFLKVPNATINHFYTLCGIPEFTGRVDSSDLNHEMILSDFKWLEQKYELPEVPTLILSSNNDIVVPNEIIRNNFLNQENTRIDNILDAGHALGFKKPSEVFSKIMNFLNDNNA